ncbi:MAG: hypothetical protein GF331_05735, partial [Chitinivibrionales bacterium]|nr:hypothetical protein [Chitinivibrionales bacterium]
DNVEHAKVAYLEDIITAFPVADFRERHESIWQTLRWAYQNWETSPVYLTLVGDDIFYPDSVDSLAYSVGVMPTWYDRCKVHESWLLDGGTVSDDYYGSLTGDTPPASRDQVNSVLAIGRIPAWTPALCSTYVAKVIRYESSGERGPWRNRIQVLADDNYQGGSVDHIGHQHMADELAAELHGRSVLKQYLSAFPLDDYYEKPAAKAAVLQTLNSGTAWTVFFGHGSADQLADEKVLTTADYDRLENELRPSVFVMLTAGNGSYFNRPGHERGMCVRYLFMPRGGALAYVASPTATWATPNKRLGIGLFSLLNERPTASLGELLRDAKEPEQTVVRSYLLMGDPAVRVSTHALSVTVQPEPDSSDPSRLLVSIDDAAFSAGWYHITLSVEDSVAPLMEADYGFVRDSAVAELQGEMSSTLTLDLPSLPSARVKATVYVWNESADGRAEVTLQSGLDAVVAHGHTAARRGAMRCRVADRAIRITLTDRPRSGTLRVRIVDIRGRTVLQRQLPADRELTIDLRHQGLAGGRYMLQALDGRATLGTAAVLVP